MPLDRGEARQQLGEARELVGLVVEVELREVVGDLLQAEHVEIRHLPGMGDDPRRVDAIVHAACPLDIPGDQLHLT
jgi:hypothetical protein